MKVINVMIKILFFLSLSLTTSSVSAGEINEFVLTDGSTLYGQVLSFENGVYQIKTESLGIMKVNASDIQVIRLKTDADKSDAPRGKQADVKSDLQRLQNTMMNNSEIMSLILSLQDDPQIQKLLADPAVTRAIQSGDVSSLLSDPRILEILNHSTVQEIQKKLSSEKNE